MTSQKPLYPYWHGHYLHNCTAYNYKSIHLIMAEKKVVNDLKM